MRNVLELKCCEIRWSSVTSVPQRRWDMLSIKNIKIMKEELK